MTREARQNTHKFSRFLLILVVGWVLLRVLLILLILFVNSWSSIGSYLYFLITILVIFANYVPFDYVLFILSIVVVILSLFRWLTKRERPHVINFLPLAIMLGINSLGMWIPSKEERAFYLHRDKFIALADLSISKVQNTGGVFHLPESSLYEAAGAYLDIHSNALVIEFIIDDYYLPLVYISTDHPDDVHGTCSEGGRPVGRFEPNWYVCRRRDWN